MFLVPEERYLRCKQREQNPVEPIEEEDVIDDEVIVRGFPKTMKARALALLERLKANPKSISWDSTGQVKLNGTLIPKSNISDLISDAMRSRKSFHPEGVCEFFKVLNDINVPKDLVRNEERWKDINKPYKFKWGEQRPSIDEQAVKMKGQKGGFWPFDPLDHLTQKKIDEAKKKHEQQKKEAEDDSERWTLPLVSPTYG